MPLPSHRFHSPRPGRPGTPVLALRLGLGLALGLGAATAARAQSLQELYEAARGYDATYLSARSSRDAAQYRLEQQYALRRPSVGLAVSGGRSLSRTPDAATQSASTTAFNATVSGSQSLFNRANDKTIAQGEKALEVSRADFETAEQDLILRVSQAYFDVLAAQDTLATARSSLTAISEQVASAKRNFEVGTATITDTREAQARYDLARATEILGENDLITKRILLDQLVGRVNVDPKQLAVPVKLPEVVPANVEDWVARADGEHPAVRRARLGLEVAKLETEKAQAGNLPTVAVSANVGRGHTSTYGDFVPTGSQNSLGYSSSSPGTSAGVALTLNLPLFAGYAIQNRVKETLVLEDKSQSDLDAARRSVAQGTRTLFYGVRSGSAQVAALEAAESSSQLALEATQLGFKVGVRVNLDVLNAQSQLFTTRTQLAKARYDVVMAGLRLRQASGRLMPEDVAAVNRLLQP
jgi:outer membrane protein